MLSPVAVELYARDLMALRLAEAAQDALAAQLPRAQPSQLRFRLRLAGPARQRLATTLRDLACRLDPCVAGDSRLAATASR
jgi:hypothetical protein